MTKSFGKVVDLQVEILQLSKFQGFISIAYGGNACGVKLTFQIYYTFAVHARIELKP
jgi:hypothetical protein